MKPEKNVQLSDSNEDKEKSILPHFFFKLSRAITHICSKLLHLTGWCFAFSLSRYLTHINMNYKVSKKRTKLNHQSFVIEKTEPQVHMLVVPKLGVCCLL